jgi:superfamily II DNA or RNA helicase
LKLRPYQHAFVDGVFEQFRSHTSTLGVMATGLGKTICFAHAIKKMCEDTGQRAMVIAHREELVRQAAENIKAITGSEPDIEMANEWASEIGVQGRAQVVVASKDTLQNKRLERFDPNDFCLLTTDEAHHAVAKSYQKIYEHFHKNPDLKHLGVTATPDRADETALGKIYESVAYEYGIENGIEDGWLVPIRQTSVTVDGLDYSNVRTLAGDLNGADLAKVLEQEKVIHEIVGPAIELARDRRTLLFAHSLAQAERICEVLNRHKDDVAKWVSGETAKDTRRLVLQNYAAGKFQFLVNVGVFTEGFDEPGVQVVVMARPTKSRSLFAQMVGRGTRPLPGLVDDASGEGNIFTGENIDDAAARRVAIEDSDKPYLEVVDFVGNCGSHKLVSVADVLGGNYDDDVVARAAKNAQTDGKSVDITEALEAAEKQIHEEKRRQQDRRLKIRVKAKYQTKSIDPFSVLDIEPWRERAYDRIDLASEKQAAAILRMTGGKLRADEMTKRQASQLIGELIGRRKSGACTFAQANILQKYGYETDCSFEEASATIDSIKENNWRKPEPETADSDIPF